MTGGGWDLEEIRRRADIVEVVSAHTRLRKAGRRLTGLCPFHQEKTPSFGVDPEKGLWHCFGCGAGGDVFRFIELTEKVPFQEAVELLARRVGVQPRTRAEAERSRARNRLIVLHEKAEAYYRNNLREKSGKQALAYLLGRGVTEQSIETFGLGYALDAWEGLLGAMEREGFGATEVARAGLAIARESGTGFYDRFRNRVIIPIRNVGGKTIGFGGRALAEDQHPKYLNSPETPLFQKGRTLWGFDRARETMAETGRAIVVEGYLDAIACHEAGLSETVATMGTALTADHVEALRRRVECLVLAFDADSAGLTAALRGRELFRNAGLEVRVASLPEGMDPDDLVHQRGGEAMGEIVSQSLPMVEWEMRRALGDKREREGRVGMERLRAAVAVLARLPAGVEREYYVKWLAEEAAETLERRRQIEAAIRQELARMAARNVDTERRNREKIDGEHKQAMGVGQQEAGTGGGGSALASKVRGGRISISLLAAMVQHGELVERYGGMLESEDFPEGAQREMFEAILLLAKKGAKASPERLRGELGPDGISLLAELSLTAVPEEVDKFMAGAVRRVVEQRLHRRQRMLQARLAAASGEEMKAIQEELAEVVRRRSELAAERIVGGM